MRGTFDFFYCPWDPYHNCNLGYAIVNFSLQGMAAEFERVWTGQSLLLPKSRNTRCLRVVPAPLQGRAANIRHFSGFELAHHADPHFRPLVRARAQGELKPMAIPSELPQHPQQPEVRFGGGDQNRLGSEWLGGTMMYNTPEWIGYEPASVVPFACAGGLYVQMQAIATARQSMRQSVT
jgi:hypothetical protein